MRQIEIMLSSLLFAICFLVVGSFRGSFHTIDLGANLWAASINMGFFNLAAQTIFAIFDTIVIVAITSVVAVFLFVLQYRRYCLLLLGAMAGDALLVLLFKTVFMSPRPLNGITAETGYSFPSGHATTSVVFFGMLTYFIWEKWDSAKVRALMGGLLVSISAVVGFSGIYLNVHWFSDIVGAVFLGAFWLILCLLLFKYMERDHKEIFQILKL